MLLAAGNWLAREPAGGSSPLGIAGWGEGGLLAFHAAAIDPRFSVVAVSGYFGPREDLATEPIYRNVFGLLRRFGDAEITRLILPRTLIIEPSRAPEIEGPPAPTSGPAARAGAAPGRIRTPAPADVDREVARARQLAGPEAARLLVSPPASDGAAFSEATLGQFLQRLDPGFRTLAPPGPIPQEMRANFNAADFQRTLVDDWSRHLQSLIAQSRDARHRALWQPAPKRDPEAWRLATPANRERFYGDVIGRLRAEALPLNPRTRPLPPAAAWTGYEVVLDVAPEVFAWGYLLFPRDLKAGERRPVVVAQHGLEGLPADLINEDSSSRAFAAYKAFASRLAERGFIVFAPHNPYRGDRFRERQRQAHPLGLTLFSFITAQHERLLDWLTTLPQVDPARIGFYGLSYGGTTALRVPALLERYAAVVCSGNFNEWVWKLCTTEWVGSYVFTKEYEMPEFNLGAAFNHAEMAGLIAPRPFMVERGHSDGVGTDEWVSFEYARVRRLYDHLRIPERTTIEYFDGPHTIHGVGSFEFLHRHLAWPVPGTGQRP
jgi:dienelactone hydrolase